MKALAVVPLICCIISPAIALQSSSLFRKTRFAHQAPSRCSRSKGDFTCFFDLFGGSKKSVSSTASEGIPAVVPPKKLVDQAPSLPKFYNSWFDGSLAAAFSNSVKAATKDGILFAEVIFPPLPNMEELEFGTALNQAYNKEVTNRLGAQENIVKKSSVAYANIDYGNQLAKSLGGNKKVYLMAFDNAVTANQVTLNKNAQLLPANGGVPPDAVRNDVVIALSPGVEGQWKKANAFNKNGAPVIGLNAPFSLSYGIGFGGKWEPIFVVKRVTKGWIYRCYPNNFKAYLDTPKGGVELIKEWSKGQIPSLKEVSALVRGESQARGYGAFNDRYLTQRL